MTGQTLRRLGLASVIGAALALPAPAIAQEKERSGQADPAQERTTEKQTAKPEKAKWTVRVFELKHRNPEELDQILTMKWTDPQPAMMASTVVMGPAGYPVRVGIPQPAQPLQPVSATQRTSGYRGESQLLVTFDPQAKLFFVRGPEEKVQKAEALVKALDVPNDQLKQVDFNDMHMIPVRQEKVQQITQTLSALRINNRTTNLGNAAFVVIRDESEDDGIVEQARTVIAKYDGGAKSGTDTTTPQNEPPKRNDPGNN